MIDEEKAKMEKRTEDRADLNDDYADIDDEEYESDDEDNNDNRPRDLEEYLNIFLHASICIMNEEVVHNILAFDNAIKLLELGQFNDLLKRNNLTTDLKVQAIKKYVETRSDVNQQKLLECMAISGYLDFSITFDDLPASFADAISEKLFFITLDKQPKANSETQLTVYNNILSRILEKC